jgi:hypothetical protein
MEMSLMEHDGRYDTAKIWTRSWQKRRYRVLSEGLRVWAVV